MLGHMKRTIPPGHDPQTAVATLHDRSLEGEFALARLILAKLAERLQDPQVDDEQLKTWTPLAFRGIKLVCDLVRQMGQERGSAGWDAVLDELSAELGVEL